MDYNEEALEYLEMVNEMGTNIDGDEIISYIKDKFFYDLEDLISFYYSLHELDEDIAKSMLDIYVNSYVFCVSSIDLDISEECAKKVFDIPFSDNLINLFGRVSMTMINAKDSDVKSKAFEYVNKIGNMDPDKLEEVGVYENGIDQTACSYGTARFCLLCYAEALIDGEHEEIDPLKGLKILADNELISYEFYDDTIAITCEDYIEHIKEGYKFYLSKKDYFSAFNVLSFIDNIYECIYGEEYVLYNLKEHQNCQFDLIKEMIKEGKDISMYNWMEQFESCCHLYSDTNSYWERVFDFYCEIKEYSYAFECLLIMFDYIEWDENIFKKGISKIQKEFDGKNINFTENENWYFSFMKNLSDFYLGKHDNLRALNILKGLDYIDCLDLECDYDELINKRKELEIMLK